MDLFSRKVLSIRISPNNSTRLSKSTLVAAIQNRDIKPGLILHSDRGSTISSISKANTIFASNLDSPINLLPDV